MKNFRKSHALVLTALALFGHVAIAPAQLNTIANIRATKHNLSASSTTSTVKASSVDQICVFCHTPHAANTTTGTTATGQTAPTALWNRKIGGASADNNTYVATYSPYQSGSLDAAEATLDPVTGVKTLPQPGGASKLCLSCHDGTLALGTVGVLGGKPQSTAVAGLTGTMPTGLGATTGFTRNLGVDLRNDHPISFTFDSNLATSDGEFRSPPYTTTGGALVVGKRSKGVKPMLPLDHQGKVQCTSCHDPHLEASRFLRLNRLQKAAPAGGDFVAANDQICLGCHNKLGTTWSQSAHADPTVADEAYTALAAGATRRDFLVGGNPAKVWEAACLNCHDTHTVQGSRRLLREGVDTTVTGADSSAYQGGSSASDPATVSAIEQTCYQCHQSGATRVIGTATGTVPDIKTEFTTRTVRMPITTAAQGGGGNTTEKHNISNADFIETPAQLGFGNHGNRHVECTDCHNPHRVRRNSLFNGLGDSTKRTHALASGTNGADGNVASGVLRGIWGVEPGYGAISGAATTWPNSVSIDYTVKRGDPGTVTSTDKISTYLTREYQLCLKCHSDYGGTSGGNMPTLGHPGGTTSNTNGVSRYTNVAAEFATNANDSLTGVDQGENGNDPTYTPGNPNGAPNSAPTNHRSWHPVIFPTGRTSYERTGSSSTAFGNIRAPFNVTANIGKQTMQCSDCHGEPTSWTIDTGPDLTKTQGPHGSSENFLLKGKWDITNRIGDIANNPGNAVCGRCHTVSGKGGFSNGDAGHTTNSDHSALGRCQFCHIAVPHGWKNKAFLVNLNCLGPEVGKPAGCTSAYGHSSSSQDQLWAAPYYNGSLLRVSTWKSSNGWVETACGGGQSWMDGCQTAKTTQQAQSVGY